MKSGKSLSHRRRFPKEIIHHAVWLYYRFCLSYRDVEDLLAERGISVSYETVRRWCRPGEIRKLQPDSFADFLSSRAKRRGDS
jgi:putative transposase